MKLIQLQQSEWIQLNKSLSVEKNFVLQLIWNKNPTWQRNAFSGTEQMHLSHFYLQLNSHRAVSYDSVLYCP